jgi:thiol peroxidase
MPTIFFSLWMRFVIEKFRLILFLVTMAASKELRRNSMSSERPGAVTLKGGPLTLVGPELQAGDQAPDFAVVDKELKPVSLGDTEGSVRIFSVVPSLDTPVCDTQTRRFNQEAVELPGVQIYTISMDLPFAQSRWCAAAGISKIKMLSDYQTGDFGQKYGTLIKELRLDSRAIFVVDEAGILQHVEYVGEVGDHPDYEAALEATKKLVG